MTHHDDPPGFYHPGMRALQDGWEGRAVADRLEERRMHRVFTEADRAFIEGAGFFFLATASAESVDCSFKGGMPGFVRVTGPDTLEFPDYDGNRMYRSLGNIAVNPRVGLLFIRMGSAEPGQEARLRINGLARIEDRAGGAPGAKRWVQVRAEHIFPNCPRYIPDMGGAGTPSVHAPREGYEPPEPEWKSRDHLAEIFEAERRRD